LAISWILCRLAKMKIARCTACHTANQLWMLCRQVFCLTCQWARRPQSHLFNRDLLKNPSNFISQCTNWNSKHFKPWQCRNTWRPVSRSLSSWRLKETFLDSFTCHANCQGHSSEISKNVSKAYVALKFAVFWCGYFTIAVKSNKSAASKYEKQPIWCTTNYKSRRRTEMSLPSRVPQPGIILFFVL